jgi:hypothetical protein
MKIEIEIPPSMDVKHAMDSISDALYFSGNVTQEEYDFIYNILQKMQS